MIKKIIQPFLIIIFCAFILALSLRGIAGNPSSLVINQPQWKENGPFELSPERGRFTLALSITENHSFFYSLPIARFATPDLGFKNGHYVSLFAPAVSFLIIPGFIIGNMFGYGQVGAYFIIAIFAIINVLLLRSIAIKLGANSTAASLGSLVFLFATPAFAYGVNLYQHHISTFLILSALYLLISKKGFLSLLLIWLLIATSIPVDYPNLFLMAPIGIAALGRFFVISKKETVSKINIKLLYVFTFIGVILPLVFFMWFSAKSYSNPFQLSGTVAGVSAIDKYGKPALPVGVDIKHADSLLNPERQKKSALSFFQTRNILNGLYIHFISSDRGIIYYAPVILFGFLGMFLAIRKKVESTPVLIGIIGANILLYSMWGDPWGGWAFGSRYLIPSFAILSIFIGLLLTYFRKRIIFMVVFMGFAIYSIAINTLGAITTSAIPPKIQVLSLEKISGTIQRYNYIKNWEYIQSGHSKSFVFQTYLSGFISAMTFYEILTITICFVFSGVLLLYVLKGIRKEKQNV